MAKLKQSDELHAVKSAVEGIIAGNVRALENAREQLPALLDNYASSLKKNGKEADDLWVAVRTLEWFGPGFTARALKDAAEDGGKLGGLQDYVTPLQRLGEETYSRVLADCRKDEGKFGGIGTYGAVRGTYGESIYGAVLAECRAQNGRQGNLAHYAEVRTGGKNGFPFAWNAEKRNGHNGD